MGSWRFSWSAIGGALSASIATGALFGLALSALDLLVSPGERDSLLMQGVTVALAVAAVFVVCGGAFLLIVSVVSRMMPWPRPWVEAAIAGALLFGVTATGDLISFNFTTPEGALPADHIVSILGARVAPTVAGVIFPIFYWLLARPYRA